MALTKDEYCLSRCKGKCCTRVLEGIPTTCPRLLPDGSCGVYHARYREGMPRLVMVGRYRRGSEMKPFFCSMIEDLIANGELEAETAKGCCYVHPELLNEELTP